MFEYLTVTEDSLLSYSSPGDGILSLGFRIKRVPLRGLPQVSITFRKVKVISCYIL